LYHVAGGQPEYTNEDLEEDLTGIHPLEIPLHSSELGRVSDVEHQHYVSTTMRTYGEPDSEKFTDISSRMSEMQIRKKSKNNIKGSSDRDQYTNAYRLRMVEVEQNLDSSNVSPAVANTTEKYTKNRAVSDKEEENEIENEEEQEQEEQEQEDDEDDDGDDNDYCSDEDDNDESGDDENGDDVNKDDENEDSGDDDDEELFTFLDLQLPLRFNLAIHDARSRWPCGQRRLFAGRSLAGIAGSNHARGMDVCFF